MPTDQAPQDQIAEASSPAAETPAPKRAKAKAAPLSDVKPVAAQEATAEATAEVRNDKQIKIDDFVAKMTEHRNRPPVVHKPAPLNDRQKSTIQLEQEAGRKRAQFYADQQKNRPPMKRDETSGSSTPVFRPVDGAGSNDQSNIAGRSRIS
jgi:hypothetical protein